MRLASAERVSRSYDLDGFRGLDIDGAWQVTVTQGADWQVEVSYPQAYEPEIEISTQGHQLRLQRETGRVWRWWGRDDGEFVARVVMPALENVEAQGANDIELSGFSGERLEIDLAGAVHLEGEDGTFDEVDVSLAGASHVDLQEVVTTDARVELAGASHVVLNMDGGILSGSMAGAGSIVYYGVVSEQSVDIAGVGSVNRAQ